MHSNPHHPDTNPGPLHRRIYGRFLRLLPLEVREQYGRDMTAAFEAYYQRERSHRSAHETLSIWFHAIVDVLRASVMFRLDRHHARRRARLVTRPQHSRNLMGTLADMLRHAGRRLRRQPGYALTCIATLAVGLGTALASLTVLKHAFVDTLPYESSDRLMTVWTRVDGQNWSVSMHVFDELRQQARSFSDQTAFRPYTATWTGSEVTERIVGTAVSDRFFQVLGARPALGQLLSPGERNDVVLSWAFWQRAFSGSPDVVGQTIMLDATPRRIAGVMPAGFASPFDPSAAFWTPIDVAALLKEPRARRNVSIVGRLAPGSNKDQADAELAVFNAQLQARLPIIHGQQNLIAEPLRDALIDTARPIILATAGGAALLVLVVAANIAGLSAARAVGLRQQTHLRMALGAGKARLLGEQLAESGVIALLGCALGTALAAPLVQIAASYQASFLPRMNTITLTAESVGIGWLIGFLACAAAVVLPQLTVGSLGATHSDWLRGGMRTATAGHARLRATLVSLQVALALALVAGAGLLMRTVHHLSTTPVGFDAALVTTLSTTLPVPKYRLAAQQLEFERAVLERLRQLPGVTSATVGGPLAGGMGASLSIFGQEQPEGRPEIGYIPVSPGFLETYGIRLVAGRDLEASDTADTPPVVVINETMARRFWPDGSAVGARVRIGPDPNSRWITVVGVIADVRQQVAVTEIRATAFGSTAQFSWPSRIFSLRVENPHAFLPRDMQAAVRAVDASVPVGQIWSLSEVLHRQIARQRLAMYRTDLFWRDVAPVVSLRRLRCGCADVPIAASRVRHPRGARRAARLDSPDHFWTGDTGCLGRIPCRSEPGCRRHTRGRGSAARGHPSRRAQPRRCHSCRLGAVRSCRVVSRTICGACRPARCAQERIGQREDVRAFFRAGDAFLAGFARSVSVTS